MAQQTTDEREYVIVSRNELIQFFGFMLLVPIQPDEDCAERAETIMDWLKSHDLAPIYELEPV